MKRYLIIIIFGLIISVSAEAQMHRGVISLVERLKLFEMISSNAVHTLTVAADIPDNKYPGRTHLKKEPGHVFVIMEKKDTLTGKSITQVWGFYPRRPVSSIFLKNVRCELLDNGGREYNAAITKQLTKEEFSFIIEQAIVLAQRKYNINKYNCYDYAVALFNSLPGIQPLPVSYVKFPFIFGRGGSPCGLYRDLEKLKESGSTWADSIQIGCFKAPVSYNSSL
jgi:hypothetical protein